MFSKRSRYRNSPAVVTTDGQGRAVKSRDLRRLPEVSSDFLHTVEEIDRLDHLAHTYYGQPTKWWRICDANPEFMSPQALLGKEPIVTDRFPLTWDDTAGQPPWSKLCRQLLEKVGVLALQIVEEVQPVPEEQVIDGQRVTIYADHYERAVVVIYNRMNVSAETLADDIATTGFEASQAERVGRVGKQITIPPDSPR